jgi:hypothetical protein
LCTHLRIPPLRQAQGRLFAKYAKNGGSSVLLMPARSKGLATRRSFANPSRQGSTEKLVPQSQPEMINLGIYILDTYVNLGYSFLRGRA